jgi:hypothetical protein
MENQAEMDAQTLATNTGPKDQEQSCFGNVVLTVLLSSFKNKGGLFTNAPLYCTFRV